MEDRLEEETEVFVVQVESLSTAGTVVIAEGTVRVIVQDNDEAGSVYACVCECGWGGVGRCGDVGGVGWGDVGMYVWVCLFGSATML